MKKILVIGGIVFVVALLAAASFWGGMAYQKNQASQALVRFEAARGTMPEGFSPGDGSRLPGGSLPEGMAQGSFLARAGTTGQVKEVTGEALVLSTATDVITVKLSDDTQIEMMVDGDLADLEPGVRVLITGQENDDGGITANRIQILSGDAPFMLEMPPAGQEP